MMKSVIIVAGGSGLRMKTKMPKQFLPLRGRPVLMYTLEAFHQYDSSINLILVLPSAYRNDWEELCSRHHFTLEHQIVEGGATRYHSVVNGLAIAPDGLIAVHDGVRPFVSTDVIDACFKTAAIAGAAIPVIEVVDTVRELTRESSRTVDRNRYRLVQTPQVFTSDLLRQAYNQPYNDTFTDDASVVEAYGHAVTLVEGSRMNIKLTTPFDFILAETIIDHQP